MATSKGLTLVEVVIVVGIVAVLASFTGFSLIRTRNTVSLDNVVNSLESDIKSQQIQSMTGYVQAGNSNPYYGIHFDENRYVLYHSATYVNGQTGNYPINLASDEHFTVINLPDSNILFATQSGEIQGFDQVRNFVTLENKNSNQQKTLYFNLYGTVYDTN